MYLGSSGQRLVLPAPTCMIVEDEALIGKALEEELRDAGFKIAGPFASRTRAIGSLDRDRPDVALLDAVLRDGSCLDLARELIRRSIPFAVYSGWEQSDVADPEFHDAPWIGKPAPFAKVVAAVREAARRTGTAPA